MIMKLTITSIALTSFMAAGAARANVSFPVNADIPQGNPVGLSSQGTVSGLAGGGIISHLTLSLDISGGYNGDLYAFLEAPSGATTLLFNQPGVTDSNPFGFGGSGLKVTFADAGASTLQNAPETDGFLFSGTYQPVTPFSTFKGQNGNGQWTLFVADLADGGGQPVLNQWSLDISTAPVPEPGRAYALGVLVLAGVAWGSARRPVASH